MRSAVRFRLPPELEAAAPPEARGLRRDHVRLLLVDRATGSVRHTYDDRSWGRALAALADGDPEAGFALLCGAWEQCVAGSRRRLPCRREAPRPRGPW